MPDPLEALIEKIHGQDDGPGAIATLTRIMENAGFHGVAYMAIDLTRGEPQARFSTSSGPAAWMDQYLGSDYAQIDPVLRGAFTRRLPYRWREVVDPARLTRLQRIMMAEAAGFGMRDGIVVPLPGPGGEYGVLSAAWDASSQVDVPLPPAVHLAAIHANAVMWQSLAGPAQPSHQGLARHLTDREVECLRWAAAGKNAGDIAAILGVTQRTVKFHTENAARKLGATGRAHAVVKALVAGIIRAQV